MKLIERKRTAIWTLVLSLALTSAAGAANDEEKCQSMKLVALGKRVLCLVKQRRKDRPSGSIQCQSEGLARLLLKPEPRTPGEYKWKIHLQDLDLSKPQGGPVLQVMESAKTAGGDLAAPKNAGLQYGLSQSSAR